MSTKLFMDALRSPGLALIWKDQSIRCVTMLLHYCKHYLIALRLIERSFNIWNGRRSRRPTCGANFRAVSGGWKGAAKYSEGPFGFDPARRSHCGPRAFILPGFERPASQG